MNHIALYRKYRPTCFKEVLGQEYILKILQNSIKTNRISHAYIFGGTKGIGKTSIAKILSKAINCTDPTDGDACGMCDNCKTIANNQSTDIIELDAASNNGVDEIRNIVESVRYLPSLFKYKVYIIDEAHMLTTSAWNALLKTIEEAPNYVVFIFATTEIFKIPATIVSRCQNFEFNRLSREELFSLLDDVCVKENINIEHEVKEKIFELSDGSARDALSVLEQCAMFADNNITLSSVKDIFGLADLENIIHLLNLIKNRDTKTIMETIEKFSRDGVNFSRLAFDLSLVLIDGLVFQQTKEIKLLKKLNVANVQKLELNEQECTKLVSLWQECYVKIKTSQDARFAFEIGVFKSMELFLDSPQIEKTPKEFVKPVLQNYKKEEPTNIVNNELPSLDKVFVTTERVVSGEQPITIDVKVENKKAPQIVVQEQYSPEEIFMAIAFSADKASIEETRKVFTLFKSDPMTPTILSYILSADQVAVASELGVVLRFNDDIDAELLNLNYLKIDFLKAIKNLFGSYKYVVGFNQQKITQLIGDFKTKKTTGEKPVILSLLNLEKIIEADNSIENIAKKLFA